MKTFKKVLALLLVAALAAGLAIVGTVAYLTHEDEEVNVFTVGNVEVELVEKQRNEAGNALEDFEDGKPLMPIVGSAQGTKDIFGMPTAANYVDKIVYARNIGASKAWMRIRIAVPVWGVGADASSNYLHWNYPGTEAWNTMETALNEDFSKSTFTSTADETTPINIDGIDYYIYTFTFDAPINPGEATKVVMCGLYLDSKVDYDPNTGHYEYGDARFTIPNNTVHIPVIVEAIQADGFDSATEAFTAAAFPNNPWEKANFESVSTSDELKSVIESANGNPTTITMGAGEYTTNLEIAGGNDITIIGNGKDTVLSGQIATTFSNAGTLTLKNLTIKVDNSIVDSTGISQTGKSAIAIWGDQTVVCENVTFEMSLADSTAITSWWDTGVGTTIIVRNCTFNCNGQRPIRATGNVTVENCTFNDPYRYAVQLTAKASTATELDKAIINFNGNTIVNGANGKAFVYGIQLEGADYGCNNCVINGSDNTIVDGGTESAMYYCECGKVDHATITWNTEVKPVHEKP